MIEVLRQRSDYLGARIAHDTQERAALEWVIETIETMPPWPPPISTMINMVNAGAVADGVTDNSAIVEKIIRAAAPGSILHFPAGTYRFARSTPDFLNFHHLTFEGDSRDESTLLIDNPAASTSGIFIWTFTDCSNLKFQNLGINNRTTPRWGGLRIYSATNLTVDHCKFFDSNKHPVTTTAPTGDHYGLVLGQGATPSVNVQITNNVFDTLQCEFDNVKKIVVRRNVSRNATCTAPFGSWAINHGCICEDLIFEDNAIESVSSGNVGGLALLIDKAGVSNTTWRRITVANNSFINSDKYRRMISLGGPASASVGHIYEDITLIDNTIHHRHTTPPTTQFNSMHIYGTDVNNTFYVRLKVQNNVVKSDNLVQLNNFGISTRQLTAGCEISGNTVTNMVRGIAVSGAANSNITANTVTGATVDAYNLNAFTGGNVFTGNFYRLPVGVPLVKTNINGTNTIEDPTRII